MDRETLHRSSLFQEACPASLAGRAECLAVLLALRWSVYQQVCPPLLLALGHRQFLIELLSPSTNHRTWHRTDTEPVCTALNNPPNENAVKLVLRKPPISKFQGQIKGKSNIE